MKERDVILTPLPQFDKVIKNRPAFILRELPSFGDFLVCGISTQIHHAVPGFYEIITRSDPDFPASNLLTESVIRLGFLAILLKNKILGIIGKFDSPRHARLLMNLSNLIPVVSTMKLMVKNVAYLKYFHNSPSRLMKQPEAITI